MNGMELLILLMNHYQYDDELLKQPFIVEATKNQIPTNIKPYNVETRRTIDSELTEKTISFMKKNVEADNPFFAFVPFTQPHLPTYAHPDFDGKTGNGHYDDVLAEIDYR